MELPVIVRADEMDNADTSTKTINISSNGIYFEFGSDMNPGSSLEFVLTLPEQIARGGPVKIKCLGKVIRVDRGGGSTGVAATIERYEFQR